MTFLHGATNLNAKTVAIPTSTRLAKVCHRPRQRRKTLAKQAEWNCTSARNVRASLDSLGITTQWLCSRPEPAVAVSGPTASQPYALRWDMKLGSWWIGLTMYGRNASFKRLRDGHIWTHARMLLILRCFTKVAGARNFLTWLLSLRMIRWMWPEDT